MSTPNTGLVKWVPDHHLENAREDCGEYPGEVEAIPVIALADLTALVEGLEMALNHQIANRGTADAFYTCYTYPHGQMPEWVERAEKALAQLEAYRKEG